MNDKNWNFGIFLLDIIFGSEILGLIFLEIRLEVFLFLFSNEIFVVLDSKEKKNVVKKKCLYNF